MSIDRHLGQSSQYISQYDSSLLVSEERIKNRESCGINPDKFVGYDVWNIHEISFLTDSGLPVVGVGKLVYPSSNKVIVESKSLKLYFFSYNMQRMGANVQLATENFERQVEKDLRELLNATIKFKFFNLNLNIPYTTPFSNFTNIDANADLEFIEFNSFNEAPDLLTVYNDTGIASFKTSLLRSNCKITNQPDWGDLYVYYKSQYKLDNLNFIKYIVSFRNENHFHEEVVEMVYQRLYDILQPDQLMVSALYTRRGGIDICPVRANYYSLIPDCMTDIKVRITKTDRQ